MASVAGGAPGSRGRRCPSQRPTGQFGADVSREPGAAVPETRGGGRPLAGKGLVTGSWAVPGAQPDVSQGDTQSLPSGAWPENHRTIVNSAQESSWGHPRGQSLPQPSTNTQNVSIERLNTPIFIAHFGFFKGNLLLL